MTSSFASEKWEQGVIKGLTANCRGIALDTEKQEEEATRIAEHLKPFDFNHRSYFSGFVLSEVINWTLCWTVFLYYFYLLDVHEVELLDILTANENYHQNRNDSLLQLFPREIACEWKYYGPSGSFNLVQIYCKCSSNDHNEYFHLIALMVSLAVFILYTLNMLYITISFHIVHAGKPTTKVTHTWNRLSFSRRLILILLRNNLDSETYNKVLNKVADAQINGSYKNRNSKSNFIRPLVNQQGFKPLDYISTVDNGV